MPTATPSQNLYQPKYRTFDSLQLSKKSHRISAEKMNQAHKAEMCKLKLVAGPGYRKALEFLIKDYLSTQPNGGLGRSQGCLPEDD